MPSGSVTAVIACPNFCVWVPAPLVPSEASLLAERASPSMITISALQPRFSAAIAFWIAAHVHEPIEPAPSLCEAFSERSAT